MICTQKQNLRHLKPFHPNKIEFIQIKNPKIHLNFVVNSIQFFVVVSNIKVFNNMIQDPLCILLCLLIAGWLLRFFLARFV